MEGHVRTSSGLWSKQGQQDARISLNKKKGNIDARSIIKKKQFSPKVVNTNKPKNSDLRSKLNTRSPRSAAAGASSRVSAGRITRPAQLVSKSKRQQLQAQAQTVSQLLKVQIKQPVKQRRPVPPRPRRAQMDADDAIIATRVRGGRVNLVDETLIVRKTVTPSRPKPNRDPQPDVIPLTSPRTWPGQITVPNTRYQSEPSQRAHEIVVDLTAPQHHQSTAHMDQIIPPPRLRSPDQQPVPQVRRMPRPAARSPVAQAKPAVVRIVVENLVADITDDDILALFGDIGPLASARLEGNDRAVVEYYQMEHAQSAVDMYHDRELDGVPMSVRIIAARSAPPRVAANLVASNGASIVRNQPASIVHRVSDTVPTIRQDQGDFAEVRTLFTRNVTKSTLFG